MIDWQRIWDDDGSISRFSPTKIIAYAISLPYSLIINIRNRLYDQNILAAEKLPCPVISVGNITVGGTGKTPCVIMLAKMLQSNGFKPAILSRGYGGKSTKAVNIVSDGHSILLDAMSAGDEPFLLAKELPDVPVITGPRRVVTAKVAINLFGANVLVCDDAMQHRQIYRDINLVLLDSAKPLGNGHLLPRGRLREPVAGLKRASAFILTRVEETTQKNEEALKLIYGSGIPVFQSVHKADEIVKGDYSIKYPLAWLAGKKVCAFCGIAKPDSFKKILTSLKTQILSFDDFPDHYPYSRRDLDELRTKFADLQADCLITTQKDIMRLQNFPEFLKIVQMLRIRMENLPSSESLENFILKFLAGSSSDKAAIKN